MYGSVWLYWTGEEPTSLISRKQPPIVSGIGNLFLLFRINIGTFVQNFSELKFGLDLVAFKGRIQAFIFYVFLHFHMRRALRFRRSFSSKYLLAYSQNFMFIIETVHIIYLSKQIDDSWCFYQIRLSILYSLMTKWLSFIDLL